MQRRLQMSLQLLNYNHKSWRTLVLIVFLNRNVPPLENKSIIIKITYLVGTQKEKRKVKMFQRDFPSDFNEIHNRPLIVK